MELVAVLLIGFLIRGAMEHSKGDRGRSRDQRVKEVAKSFPKGSLPKSKQKAAARHAAAGWWAREVRHGFPVHRTGWHAAWLAHQTVADHHKARREEARTTALETRASVLKGMPEHKQRQAEAQAELDKIHEELAAQQAKGSPATGRKAVQSAADEVARKRTEREQATGPGCPGCGAPEGYDHLAGCDPSVPPLPADGVTLLTARSKSGRPVNAVTGEPEDTVAVYGKEDLDRRLSAAADDPDIEVSTRPAPRTEDPDLPDASRNPQPINTTASPTTEGAPVADTNYDVVMENAKKRADEAEQDAVAAAQRHQAAMQHAEDMQAVGVQGATLSAQMDLVDQLKKAEDAHKAITEQAVNVRDALAKEHGGIKSAVDDAPIPRPAETDFYVGS